MRDSEARLLAFTEHSPAAMYLKDAAGRYRFANRNFLGRHGLRPEQVLGRRDEEIFAGRQALAASAASDAEVLRAARRVRVRAGDRAPRTASACSMVSNSRCSTRSGAVVGLGGVGHRHHRAQARRAGAASSSARSLPRRRASPGSAAGNGTRAPAASPGPTSCFASTAVAPAISSRPSRPISRACIPRTGQMSATVAARAAGRRPRLRCTRSACVRPDGSERHGAQPRRDRARRRTAGRSSWSAPASTSPSSAMPSRRCARPPQDLQSLTRRLVQAEEAERRRIARRAARPRRPEPLGAQHQSRHRARRARRCAAARGALAPATIRSALVEARCRRIENVMADLRPPLLEEYGLGAALGWYARGVRAPHRHRLRGRGPGARANAAPAARSRGGAVPHRPGGAQQRREARAATNVRAAAPGGGRSRRCAYGARRRPRLRPGSAAAPRAPGA